MRAYATCMVASRTRSLRLALIAVAILGIGVGVGVYELVTPASPRVVWSSDFSRGNFTGWSWWGQGQASIWGHIAVVRPQTVDVPKLSGRNIARFQTTRADLAHGRTNAKLYKLFDVKRPHGVRPPANVSGTYSASYYLPHTFRVPKRNEWVNLFQFKEQYTLPGGGSHSDPLWWVQLGQASWAETYPGATWLGAKPTSPAAPVMFLNHWNNRWTRHVVFAAVPLGRWFKISAAVHQGSRIDFNLDGHRFDTATAREYPVSPFHSTSQAWIFGVGDYGTAPAGPLYVGAASLSTPPTG